MYLKDILLGDFNQEKKEKLGNKEIEILNHLSEDISDRQSQFRPKFFII
jgi:hypothetical protein